jgi:hypothetical protein
VTIDRKRLESGRVERRPLAAPAKRQSWNDHEARVAEAVPGGQRTRGSGCSPHASRKSDVVSDLWRVEAKSTEDAASLSVKVEWLAKVKAEADATTPRRLPVFAFDISGEAWMAYPEHTAKYMMRIIDAIKRGEVAEARALVGLLTP